MSISVRKDVKPLFGFGNTFQLKRDTPYFFLGSYLDFIRRAVADQKLDDWHDTFVVGTGTLNLAYAARDINIALARNFNMREQDVAIYKQLWPITSDARAYNKKVKDNNKIEQTLQTAYELAAILADDGTPAPGTLTWSRVVPSSDPNFVIFSDHHMTNFTRLSLPNYFKDYNYQLYLDVLNHYADLGNFTLVENGDVEECVIYEPTETEAKDRKKKTKKWPIKMSDPKWDPFMEMRYTQRMLSLNNVIATFHEYYDVIRNRFEGRYVRLTGNHDTYLDEERERDLRDRIELELGIAVQDVLKISRNGQVRYLVMHGHQFDTVSMQHGSESFAKSLGEVYSETSAWAYQGPDRFWENPDTDHWIYGGAFRNFQAREEPKEYTQGSDFLSVVPPEQWNLLNSRQEVARNKIKADPKGCVESVLGHEIAWEYFENSNAYDALCLEVLTGEEMFKFRHLNERNMCQGYSAAYINRVGLPLPSTGIPKLVLGHTHEPRQNSVNAATGDIAPFYLNTGSAGRFSNLIWCVEIVGETDRIVSWSRVDGRLKKIIWRSEHSSTTTTDPIGRTTTQHRSDLVHDSVEWH